MTIAQLAREHNIHVALEGYKPFVAASPDDRKRSTIIAPEDGITRDEEVVYEEGELVEPFDMFARHLRIVAASRTAGGRISADAKRASAELARRAANRPVKKAAKSAVVGKLAELGLLD